jgi:hypothetical protein
MTGGSVEVVVVHAIDERRVGTRARRRNNNERCAGVQVPGSLVARGEDAGRLNHDVHAEVAPWEVLRISK